MSKWKKSEKEGLPPRKDWVGGSVVYLPTDVLPKSNAKLSCSQPSSGSRNLVFIGFSPDTWEPWKSTFN